MAYLQGKLGWALLLAAGLLFPLFTGNDYHLTVMGTAYIFAIATIGLEPHHRLYAFNPRTRASWPWGPTPWAFSMVDHGWSFWGAFALSGVVTAFLGYFIGILSSRLKGHYFSIFTLCVGYIMFLVIEKWEGLTHGTVGIMGIPAPEPIGAIRFDTPLALYYLVFFWLVVGLWAMRRIVNSLLGRTFMAIRNSDELAESPGINLMRNKTLAFMLSVFYAGMAGGLYAGYVCFIGPGVAGVEHT